MTPSFRSWPTLLAASLFGAAIGIADLRNPRVLSSSIPAPMPGSSEASGGSSFAPSPDGKRSFTREAENSSADAYAAAWELLKAGPLCGNERLALQCSLLKEWSLIDLESALRAAFAEEAFVQTYDPFNGLLSGACRNGIECQSGQAWELIQTRRFGLHTIDLRHSWIHATGKQRPLELILRLADLPAEDYGEAFWAAVEGTHRLEDPAPGKEEVLAAVLALRGTTHEKQAMSGAIEGLASTLGRSDLKAKLLSPTDPQLRALYFDTYMWSIDSLRATDLKTELDSLSATLRTEVEASALFPKKPRPDEPEPVWKIVE